VCASKFSWGAICRVLLAAVFCGFDVIGSKRGSGLALGFSRARRRTTWLRVAVLLPMPPSIRKEALDSIVVRLLGLALLRAGVIGFLVMTVGGIVVQLGRSVSVAVILRRCLGWIVSL
jgi:hypothetical protein